MLENLLESKSKRGRSVGGTITSISAHTALIGAALYATAQARVKPPITPDTEVLRGSGVEGQVTALFIVDEKGRAEESSLRFVRSNNELFEEAVRVALRRMRFNPAQVGGRKVRQLVQMPFVFTLAR